MSQPVAKQTINEEKMHAFLGKVVSDFGASLSSVLGFIGLKLGLYDALADSDGMTSEELAAKTGTNERYIREWLLNQASGDYLSYDAATGKYSMLPEQREALTDESSPYFVGGGFYVVKAMVNAQPRIAELFRSGGGMHWGDHDPDLFVGTEKFFRPGYSAFLTTQWIPALNGIEEKLKAGAKIADIGCGHGASTVVMAKAFPKSEYFGFDSHPDSIEIAKERAAKAGIADRSAFATARADDFPDNKYDLICFFDCLHDMGDPVGALKHSRECLAPNGSVLIVEPMAGNTPEENFNPIGRTFSAASTLCCTPNAIAQGGSALGAVATEDKLRSAAMGGGFTSFERVAETPFNRVFEARA
ncbi:MAG: type 12 methyltransferase [Acidobacteria bacterium OLB17]|nr:MAG: type 12 methyltransferase [Acidobacteria bacterium OLB17]MCZ2391815.1 methyltransferase domain-containing protein [Acidobacteriota bacterium]